jgi:hypothetical protein
MVQCHDPAITQSGDETNPNDIIAVHRFKDMKGAKDFANAVPLIMESIGVIGKPEIWFAEDLEQVTYS